jgi:hypothetical protein
VLDRAPDVFVLGTARRLHEEESYAAYAPAGSEQWLKEPVLPEPAEKP